LFILKVAEKATKKAVAKKFIAKKKASSVVKAATKAIIN
jgi:hypothetical protein